MATSPLPSRGPTRGRNSCVNVIFSRCQQKGIKPKVAASPLPSWGPRKGRKFFAILAFWGVPKEADKIRIAFLPLASSRAQKWAQLLRNLCVLGGPQQRGQNQKWLLDSKDKLRICSPKQYHQKIWHKWSTYIEKHP